MAADAQAHELLRRACRVVVVDAGDADDREVAGELGEFVDCVAELALRPLHTAAGRFSRCRARGVVHWLRQRRSADEGGLDVL